MDDTSSRIVNDTTRKLRRKNWKVTPADILAFLLPSLHFVRLKLVGELSGSDLLLLFVFLVLAFRGKIRFPTPTARRLMVLCVLWLASQCLTDIVRHSAFADYARGWSNIGFTLVNFAVFFSLLYGRRERLAIYGWGLVLGALLTVLINPDQYMQVDPWKFGYSPAFTWAAVLVASRKKLRAEWAIAVCMFAGLTNIYMGARSIGGMCLAVALYLAIAPLLRRRADRGAKLGKRVVVAVALSVVLCAVGIYSAYKYAASSGMLGDDAREKYEEQSSGRYGILLGGRTEMLGYLPAIYDSPLLGHGSWAREPSYLIMERQALVLLGYTNAEDLSLDAVQEGYIPTHSYIFGAWVDAGILGAVFWIWIFSLTVKAMRRLHHSGAVLLPLASFAAFSMFWDLLFSPFGAVERITAPYYIVLLVTCLAATVQSGECARKRDLAVFERGRRRIKKPLPAH